VLDVLEAVGLLLLVVFAFLVWPPAAVGVAGVLLVVGANLRAQRAKARR
jgi:hypothetical protein